MLHNQGMAMISARGARKVCEVKAKLDESTRPGQLFDLADVTYTFTLCSDGRVLVKNTRPSGYTTPGMPATISSGFSVWCKVSGPLGLPALELGKLEARIERAGFTIVR